MARNRIIYQSQALFIGPNSTGYHLQKAPAGTSDANTATWSGVTGLTHAGAEADAITRSLVLPLERIQSANFNFSINRIDVNEFGKLARLDSIVTEAPTVGLDFNYYLTDGGNERKLGFNIPTTGAARASASSFYDADDLAMSGYSALSGQIDDTQGNNYYILLTKEGEDVDGDTKSSSADDFDVVAIGNGFITDYSVEAAVGSLPTASVTVEAFNIKVDNTMSGATNYLPAVGLESGIQYTGQAAPTYNYTIQGNEAQGTTTLDTEGSSTIKALRPGDLVLTISGSENYQGLTTLSGDGKAHIQSFTISTPMSRTVLQRLGNTFGYARVIDLPLNMEVSISAIMSELKKSNIFHTLCNTITHNFTLDLYGCDSATGTRSSNKSLRFEVKGARLESETFSSAIGDNQTVDITFSCQIGGANDQNNGLFMEGTYPLYRCLKYLPLGANKGVASSYNPHEIA